MNVEKLDNILIIDNPNEIWNVGTNSFTFDKNSFETNQSA